MDQSTRFLFEKLCVKSILYKIHPVALNCSNPLSSFIQEEKTALRRSFLFGRSEGIRTPGLMDPNHARYQTSPHPDNHDIIMKNRAIVKSNPVYFGNIRIMTPIRRIVFPGVIECPIESTTQDFLKPRRHTECIHCGRLF